MMIGLCQIEMHLPGVASLKEKRSILKSMLARIHNTFNVSAAETGHHDVWQSAEIALAIVSNSNVHNQQVLNRILEWIENNYEVLITSHEIETL
ncbi:MAG: DUF503 domain-containing protein [Anaerolineaceae bacterium]|nr:DUF503 domain-containing protein [Anaerolineaceae bacterium]